MAKTRKRQIKKRGGASCLFVLGSIIDSINNLIKAIDNVKTPKEVGKKNQINSDFHNFVVNAFDSQINATCTDITKNKYTSLINRLDALSTKFGEKEAIFYGDTQVFLTPIGKMKTRATELSDLIVKSQVSLPTPPPAGSKIVKKKTSSKVVENTNVMPPLQHMLPLPPMLTPTLMQPHVAAATAEEKAAREAAKNAAKKERRTLRNAASASKAEEDARKKIAKKIADEAASKIAAKKNAEKQKNIQATVQMLEEKAARKAAEEEAARKAAEEEAARKAAEEEAARKAAEEARVNDITESNIELFFEDFIITQIVPLGIITLKQANKYVTTLFPNIKFTDKIADYQESASIQQQDSESYMYYSYLYIMYIGILNNYLYVLTEEYPDNLFAGLKLVFKGGRAAQIMLPKESNLLSDDTDIFIQSTNIEHTQFFLKTFAIKLAKSWSNPQLITFRIGKVNPNIVKIAYRGSTRFIPISDIDFGSPTYPQYYDDIRMVRKTWKIIQEPLTDEGKPATKLVTKPEPLYLVYYHQSPELFFAEKREIYNLYSNPFYKNCNCRYLLHTEECVASCSERQFYLDKFKKYVDVKTTTSSSKRKTRKKTSNLPL